MFDRNLLDTNEFEKKNLRLTFEKISSTINLNFVDISNDQNNKNACKKIKYRNEYYLTYLYF